MRTFGPWARRIETAIVAVMLLSAAALAAFESRSSLASALRAGEPVVGLVILRGPAEVDSPSFFLTIYHPLTRSLDALQIPAGESPQPRGRTLGQLYRQAPGVSAALAEAAGRILDPGGAFPAARFVASAETDSDVEGSPQAFHRWVESWPRGPAFWASLALAARRGRGLDGAGPYETALLALEAYRLAPASVRPVWLPAPALRPRLVSILLAAAPPLSTPPEIKVQVLNASGEVGVALRATKVLRWHQVDVIEFGNASEAEAETRIIDRVGKPQDARHVAKLLGCGDAEVWTQFDPQASVPLAVVLGRDFRRCRGLPNDSPLPRRGD